MIPTDDAPRAPVPSESADDRLRGRWWRDRNHDFLLLLAVIVLFTPIYLVAARFVDRAAASAVIEAGTSLSSNIPGRVAEHLAAVESTDLIVFDPGADDRVRAVRSALADPEVVRQVPAEQLKKAEHALVDSILAKFFGYEQYACYILSIWSVLMIRHRGRLLRREIDAFAIDPLRLRPGEIVTPAESTTLYDRLSRSGGGAASRSMIRTLSRALLRFESTRDVAAAESVVHAEASLAAETRDADLGLARYAIWAIPSVGFIGTVRGIGAALGVADNPENIGQIVSYLAVAFDTTLVALALSIGVMFLLHQYQRANDSSIDRLIRRCDDVLISHMSTAGDRGTD